MRQALDLFGQVVGSECFESLDDARMQQAPSLLEQTAVGHLVRQGVLEGVRLVRKEARLVEELGRLEVRQATVQLRLRQLGDGLEHGQGHLGTNHRGGLEQTLLLGRQPVNACRQHRLHRRRHVQGVERLRQTIRPRCSDQETRLHQRAHALFQKERIALGAGDQQRS